MILMSIALMEREGNGNALNAEKILFRCGLFKLQKIGEKMKSLVIGNGEVGKAIYENIKEIHESYIRDVEEIKEQYFDVIHVCYPDQEKFIEITKKYIDQYRPLLSIIHSSVKPGTTRQCGEDVLYSPVRGRHPGLPNQMKHFCKFFIGQAWQLSLANQYFKRIFQCEFIVGEPDSFEFYKLISNVHLGLEISWRQEVERIFDHLNLDKTNYEKWEASYNAGLISLKESNLIRPIMNPHPIGGHCILPCLELMKNIYPSKFFDLILESNNLAIQDKK